MPGLRGSPSSPAPTPPNRPPSRDRDDGKRRGRRGLRTSVMVQVAQDRIVTLFARAEEATRRGFPAYADQYVRLARRIATRYNVRLTPEVRSRFCRGCLVYFVEGATVRTRLRDGRRVRTCLRCHRSYRTVLPRRSRAHSPVPAGLPGGPHVQPLAVPVDELGEDLEEPDGEPDEA